MLQIIITPFIPAYKIGFNSAVERRSIKDSVEKQTFDFFFPQYRCLDALLTQEGFCIHTNLYLIINQNTHTGLSDTFVAYNR